MRVDIYVEGQVAIEVHGEQHFRPINFSYQIDSPEQEFERRQKMDAIKQSALKLAGIPSVVIIYSEIEDLTLEILREKIYLAQINIEYKKILNPTKTKPGKFRTRNEAYEAKQKYFRELRNKKAREFRKKKYKEMKGKKQK